MLQRRQLLLSAAGLSIGTIATVLAAPANAGAAAVDLLVPQGPRSRLVMVNDLAGDVDGLFALVHALISPGVEVRGVVASGDGEHQGQVAKGVKVGTEALAAVGRADLRVLPGAPLRMAQVDRPIDSPGTRAIIAEAMRTDSKLPLFVGVGGGLTEVASAILLEPSIADRMTLVWIGGAPYPAGGNEYNFSIDPIAAQVVFDNPALRIWQVPMNAYAQCVISASEILLRVRPWGSAGAWLFDRFNESIGFWNRFSGMNTGATWTMGDSPLVLLTALTGWFPSGGFGTKSMAYEQTGSSLYDEPFAPQLNRDGTYAVRAGGKRIRSYRTIDTRTMFEDFFARLQLHAGTAAAR
jgi:purine nucleosidase